jgi:hypothetical protein
VGGGGLASFDLEDCDGAHAANRKIAIMESLTLMAILSRKFVPHNDTPVDPLFLEF